MKSILKVPKPTLLVLSRKFIALCTFALAVATCVDGIQAELIWGEFSGGEGLLNTNAPQGAPTIAMDEIMPNDIQFDPTDGKVYWTQRQFDGFIRRIDLNGANFQTIISTGLPSGLDLDVPNNKIYWSAQSENRIMSADLNGTNQSEVLGGSILPSDLFVDPANNSLYFVNTTGDQSQQGAFSIEKVSLDGQSHTVLADQLIQVTGLDADLVAGKMYWADLGVNNVDDTRIYRANLDGSNVEQLLENLPDVILSLVIRPGINRMFWTSRDEGVIKSATLSGLSMTTEISGISGPHGLAVIPEPSAIPEPSTLTLASLALLGLLAHGHRRRRA